MKKRFTVKNSPQSFETDPESAEYRDNSDSQIDLFVIAGNLLKHKRLIAIVVLVVMFIAAIKILSFPNTYVSRASILPSGKANKLDKLKELAGLSSSVNSDENSSSLFPVILRANLIQDTVLSKTYTFLKDGIPTTGTFQDYFGCYDPDLLRLNLAAITDIYEDIATGVIYLSVETDSPEFSQAVLQNYIDELEAYNLNKRYSRAKDNITYLERELTIGADKLSRAENDLEAYQMANRNWDATADPEVVKTLSRLRRDIEVKTRMYTFLTEQYEISKLDVQKDIPIVRILDKPSLPTISSRPKLGSAALLSGVISLVFMIFLIIAYESLKKRSQGPDRKSFETLRNDLENAFPRSVRTVNLIRRTGKKEVSLIEN